MSIKIIDLEIIHKDLIDQIANILVDCFKQYSPSWVPDQSTAKQKVLNSLVDGYRSRVLVDHNQTVLGWAGGIAHKNVWEIHPIAVSKREQRKGYGRLLVEDVSAIAKANGAVAVWAGTGDETGATSFAKTDLYKNTASALVNFQVPENHPVNFWLRVGFTLVGVLPDEEGLGKPGIHFSRRLV